MFTTFESAELKIPPIFEYPDQRWWGYVGLYRSSGYFHMVIEYDDERGDRVTRTLWYAGVDQVLGTAEASELQIVELQLMMPPSMLGRKIWSMEPLCEILLGFEPDTDRTDQVAVYVLAGGQRIVASLRCTSEDDLVELESMLRINTRDL
jgi:hypothetical protein